MQTTRAAVFFLLLCAAGQALAAEALPPNAGYSAGQSVNYVPGETRASPAAAKPAPVLELPLLGSGADGLGDIFGGRGPSTRSRELAEIAIAAANDNRDAVEIISQRIRKFGATQEEIQDVIDSAKLHTGAAMPQSATLSKPSAAPSESVW